MDLWRELSGGRWGGFVWVLGAYVLQQFLGTFALWVLGTNRQKAGWKETGLARLARVRYVGEVLNYSMPTGGLGGEPYKYLMLRKREGRKTAFDALAAAKFLHVAGVGPFATAVFFGAAATDIGGEAWRGSLFLFGAISFMVTAAVWVLVLWRGPGRALTGLFYRIRRRVPRRLRGLRRLLNIDRATAGHIKRSGARAAAAYCCYMGMWAAAALEWLAISWVVGTGAGPGGAGGLGLVGAGLFECATILVAGAFPIPAGVGTQEAGKMAVAVALGMAPETGVAMSFIRRAREAVMILAGVMLGLVESRARDLTR